MNSINGDCKTDPASAFADVTLTVESQPDEQFTLASGGRYYFDLSTMNITRNGKQQSAGQHPALCAVYLCGYGQRLQAHIGNGNHRGVCSEE